jgi:hypothetical protein
MVSNFFGKNRVNILAVIAVLAYNDLFYGENLGINILVFTALLFFFLGLLYPGNFRNTRTLASAGITLMLTFIITWHHSMLSCWMYFISFFVSLGFIVQPKLRFTGYAILAAMDNILKVPKEIFDWKKRPEMSRKTKVSRILAVSMLPVFIVMVFYFIYTVGNPVFADLGNRFFREIGHWIEVFFRNISPLRLLFILSGLVLISGILYHRNPFKLLKAEEELKDDLVRSRMRFRIPFLRMDFRNEFLGGIILMVLMNLMLLALNIIDIKYIWINFTIPQGVSLKEMVHEGTEWLIASIILSMLVVIWIFRANQNFYSRSHILKYLACAWIAQNMILAISLLLRNNQYIAWHALAYKRLGVYVFIFLTFCGLITMLVKVWKAKSFFYLVRVNSWIAYIVLSGICLVNWDMFIAKYNINFKNGSEVDTDFYLTLSPKAYPVIWDNLDKIEEQINAHSPGVGVPLEYPGTDAFISRLDGLGYRFMASHSDESWRSYNMADENALEYLKSRK